MTALILKKTLTVLLTLCLSEKMLLRVFIEVAKFFAGRSTNDLDDKLVNMLEEEYKKEKLK